MKFISETSGLQLLKEIHDEFAEEIREAYEHLAKPCSACATPGACCVDEHFVNVRVTRLEARAIRSRIEDLGERQRRAVYDRVEAAAGKLEIDGEEPRTYACPLFEKGVGCLVHDTAKPLPCIAHACYERKEDLPPNELLAEREMEIAQLNRKVYGKVEPPLPIPIAIASRRPV